MMIIAHRGNIHGPNPEKENTTGYLQEAMHQGYQVELDLIGWNGTKFVLGHDVAQEQVDPNRLRDPRIWCHCKDYNTFTKALEYGLHCFWHQEDDYTMTSRGYIWAYPGKDASGFRTIMVKPELNKTAITDNVFGICTDYAERYKEKQ